MELVNEREKYPTSVKQIDVLKKEYIICMNAISVRDYNKVEKTRVVINALEQELKEIQKEYEADQRRYKKAQLIIIPLKFTLNKKTKNMV